MWDWAVVFSSSENSGVYALDNDTRLGMIKKAAADLELSFHTVDLKRVEDRSAMLQEIASALKFPDYFGMNLDALNDCLTDMSWDVAAGYVILLKKFTVYERKFPVQAKSARGVFDAAALYWKQQQTPFYIILS